MIVFDVMIVVGGIIDFVDGNCVMILCIIENNV